MDIEAPPRLHILFVCTANVDRSPTAERLYRDDPRYEVRSAGVAPFATRRVTEDLLLWADRVFVMNESEDHHISELDRQFRNVHRPTFDLDVPDRWPRDHPDLEKRLLRSLRPYLGPPQSPAR